MNKREVYLGDAVIASFDGCQVWLRTDDGNSNRIALEPPVLQAFLEYVEALKRSLAETEAAQITEAMTTNYPETP